jgi:hypothetical protein
MHTDVRHEVIGTLETGFKKQVTATFALNLQDVVDLVEASGYTIPAGSEFDLTVSSECDCGCGCEKSREIKHDDVIVAKVVSIVEDENGQTPER